LDRGAPFPGSIETADVDVCAPSSRSTTEASASDFASHRLSSQTPAALARGSAMSARWNQDHVRIEAIELALSRIVDDARRAELRGALYAPGTCAVFKALRPAGQSAVLAAMAYAATREALEDIVQREAVIEVDPQRQKRIATRVRGRHLTWDLDDAEARTRRACSEARREHHASSFGQIEISGVSECTPLDLLMQLDLAESHPRVWR
jgi:hypothetical protein